MHTLQVIVGGLLLLTIFILFGRALGGRTRRRLLLAFIPVWLACALFNLWIGVTRGGYSVMEELPYFVAVFGVPSIAAWLLSRRHAKTAAA